MCGIFLLYQKRGRKQAGHILPLCLGARNTLHILLNCVGKIEDVNVCSNELFRLCAIGASFSPGSASTAELVTQPLLATNDKWMPLDLQS